ncbi:aldose 1-epimerase family protein [Rathayibacter rathayi]|uniref:aldose 1-epimerase family protein n=1 Tax=Rathayibacter rathayi TaxID=33887 RepID=UPI000BD6742D|nr:aldose 1-epimerase family protein [Rathayibacter rathayi]AZZ48705.1 aldose 1-epimerase family protein [Rathayibacter rathayi]MWV73782.1 aldose 1-epimerase family protein [Rathayibacter rathayi NCPPB 2980 = VKM Ac-1601]PPF50851.1 aldose 1-epimerase family protein [Rathayibacter rathayi]PPG66661.1 aldose 1-epimerase family protein [Rathayibacter rathayi]PPG80143.1 aldose 1-epimerase family protein [Rathayibacter rathayi]
MSSNDSPSPTVLALGSESLRIALTTAGAEMTSLRDGEGREYLWQAGPEWRRHAPVLFPIIGRLPGDALQHDGVEHRMGQHGFARDRVFDLAGVSADEAVFRLRSDDATRAMFPFDWTLLIAYAVTDATLRITQTLENRGSTPLGYSLGNHPAFALPLPGGRGEHRIRFAQPEPEGYRRAPENLLLAARHPAPLEDGVLAVDDGHFAEGVMIFDESRRRTLRLEADGAARSIEIDTGDFDVVGVWKPVGARFVCLEPWRGVPTPEGWDGDIVDKPGQIVLGPGEQRTLSSRIALS